MTLGYYNRIPDTFIYHLTDIFSKVEEDAHSRTQTIKTEMDQMDLSDLESEKSDQEHFNYLDHGTKQESLTALAKTLDKLDLNSMNISMTESCPKLKHIL